MACRVRPAMVVECVKRRRYEEAASGVGKERVGRRQTQPSEVWWAGEKRAFEAPERDVAANTRDITRVMSRPRPDATITPDVTVPSTTPSQPQDIG